MAANRITEGVGKKIVDALKAQSDIEIHAFKEEIPVTENVTSDIELAHEEPMVEETFEPEITDTEDEYMETSNFEFQPEEPAFSNIEIKPQVIQPQIQPQPVMQNTMNFTQPAAMNVETDLEGFEIPTNVAVLKQLIAKLPSGVTKQTGAQIIKQTMEALGISMKGVLQEAQGVQEGLSNSSRECQATISEYRRQIGILEKQAQKYQRQYTALNDIISLFIQTGN